ncbi:Kdo2-lipid IVA lauroyltransferase/acyltransferase [Candidatus Magnetomoraceae bacterium gMMP-1]
MKTINSNSIIYKAAYRVIAVFFKILSLIPKKWGTLIGCFLGRILFVADKKHRKIAINNLSFAFNKKESEVRELALKVFENLGKIIFELIWSLGLDKKRLFKHFRIDGLSNIQNAHKKGKGILILTAHFGNWELLTVGAAMTGYPGSLVFRPLDFKPLDQFIKEARARFGAKAIPKKRSFRAILRSLGRGEIAALLMDQNVSCREGVFVDFFGHRACTNKGLALLAMKTQAPVVPMFLVREKQGFVVKFLPEISLIKTGDKTKDVEENTQQYNNVIESIVCEYPDQWFWVHQRWKTKAFSCWPRNP